MKKITRAAGNITFTLPESAADPRDLSVASKQKQRGTATTAESVNQEIDHLLAALTEDNQRGITAQDCQVYDSFSLDLGEGEGGNKPRRRGSQAKSDVMEINVKLDPGEGVILLVEQEGSYEWHFPEEVSLQRGPSRRGRPGAVNQKTALFRIPIGEGESVGSGIAPKKRSGVARTHRGPITNFVQGKIAGFILRFAAKQVVGALSKRLETGVEPGPVIITSGDDTNGWSHTPDYLSVDLPKTRPARILLLVHGTFSSTIGSYGALTEQPAGRRFLDSALNYYDAVLGYDHYTLAETPAQNAEALFEALLGLEGQSQGIEIDAVSFSRGGLVYRYLTEQIVPFEKTRLAFRTAIFVACTNAGTELANDENWKYLVDFYTNMVAGAARLLGKLPNAKLPMEIFGQAVKAIGSLVKYMAQDAVEDNAVPGISAMEPLGSFIKALNAVPTVRTRSGARSYYAIGSNFEPDRSTYSGELGKRLAIKVADGLVDGLMGEANDLVVDTDSMFVVDPVPSAKLLEQLSFGENGEIYHTVYFNQPQVARQCAYWLGLVQTSRSVSDNEPRTRWQGIAATDPVGVVTSLDVLSSDQRQRGLLIGRSRPDSGTRRGLVVSRPDKIVEEAPEPATVWCNAHANMPEEAVIGKKTTVEVTLSRDKIIREKGAFGGGAVQPDKDLIVQVLARKHCIVSGESRIEVPVPPSGQEVPLFFDVIPKHEGVGEVNVIVRQGNRPIANLKLFPRFLLKASGEVVEDTIAEVELTPVDARHELANVLYIREGEMGLKQVLHFDFESRSLNKIVRCTSQPFKDEDARKEYITSLYEELENFWADDALEYDSFMRKLQARGVEIFDKLIPLELRKVLWDARESLDAIQVISDEPFIPWELAYLKEPGRKAVRGGCFLAEKGLVRWLAEAEQFPPQRLRLRDGKASYVIPEYPAASGYQLAGARTERKMLEEVLSAQPITPTSSMVQGTIETPGCCDILHFACHGLANPGLIWDSGLMMEGRMKNKSYQHDNLLSSQVEAFADLQEPEKPGPLVFLNACQVGRQGYNLTGTGGFARAFVKSGAGAFISTHWSVGDMSALVFSKTLYEQLLAGNTMMDAVAAARNAAKNEKEMTWLSYVVYADPYVKLIKE